VAVSNAPEKVHTCFTSPPSEDKDPQILTEDNSQAVRSLIDDNMIDWMLDNFLD